LNKLDNKNDELIHHIEEIERNINQNISNRELVEKEIEMLKDILRSQEAIKK